jgi:type I restriction enzyme M protein
LDNYWKNFPQLKNALFSPLRKGYLKLNVALADVKSTIFNHPEFTNYNQNMQKRFAQWLQQQQQNWESFEQHFNVKEELAIASQSVLETFVNDALVDEYAMYQHFMQYWNSAMMDDFYSISLDGWKAGSEYTRLIVNGKKGKDGKTSADKEISGLAGLEGRMISPQLLIDTYFKDAKEKIESAEQMVEQMTAQIAELEEEHNVEDGLFADLEKINAGEVTKLLKLKKAEQKVTYAMVAEPKASYGDKPEVDEIVVLEKYLSNADKIKVVNQLLKTTLATLEKQVEQKYPTLSEADVKDLVIHKKWTTALQQALTNEQEKLSQTLTQRIIELAERYENTLPQLMDSLNEAESKVKAHLQKMGLIW